MFNRYFVIHIHMKIRRECVSCLLQRTIFECNLVRKEKADKVVKEVCGVFYKHYSPNAISAELATHVHKKAYEIIGSNDPYYDLKKKSNDVALSLRDTAEKIIETSDDMLKTAIVVSIVGNLLDFGIRTSIGEPEDIKKKFNDFVREGLGHDDSEKIKKYLGENKKIIYFTDNAGEIIFDALLMKIIKSYGCHLAVVVRGEPVLTDATYEDAIFAGIDKIADELWDTGGFAVGVNFRILPKKVLNYMKNCDLIISKGMANFESFSDTDWKPIIHLLRAKCQPVANAMNVIINTNVAKLYDT